MGFSPEQHNDRKGVKILPGEVFCRIEFERWDPLPNRQEFLLHIWTDPPCTRSARAGYPDLDGKWEGCDAEERSKGGRPTRQAIAKALVVYKQWNKLISAEDEAAEEAGKQTVNQRFAEERADKAQRFSEKQSRSKTMQAGLDHEATKSAEDIRLNAKYYF
ncbi:uncharacterized protein PODANS_2_10835 [Podospora anserina S mat+]|uniref:Podospora anserina S mat+ genomic DNA chromosome 2, supercontig 2 n=1 Tax=Podospora anserina (strain S / ATCC MYA-4624 / DSM 980 / FGSC 10383) TaxID=515849 RepID=B2B7E5_PODAN|nr:uncharacterized protein PODANS_2_10835 [Podospora anserina S mat+]CAP73723.1 unnamed protein product [Podospora anserina S mat+]CDP26124.1 Putative protein of unknown function [Podospora anserina S mat+]